MRESLTVAAIALVLVLTAALIGPYFFDWSQARGLIETRLSSGVGAQIRINGAIDVKLLPTPYLVAEDVAAEPKSATEFGFSAKSMRLELTPMALLAGQFNFTDASFDAPVFNLSIKDNAIALPGLPASTPNNVRFDSVNIKDGTLNLRDANGQIRSLTGLNAIASATSLQGPFKADGTFNWNGAPSPFHLNTGTRDASQLRLKLNLPGTASHPLIGLDGTLTLVKSPAFDGFFTTAGTLNVTGQEMPFATDGAAHLNLSGGQFDTMNIKIGDEDRNVKFTGTADVTLGNQPHLSAKVAAGTLDLDSLFAPDQSGRAKPLELLDKAKAAAKDLLKKQKLVSTSLDVTVDSVVLGGDSLSALHVNADLDGPASRLRLEGNGPAGSHILAEGNLTPDLAFTGKIDAATRNLGRLQSWLTGNDSLPAPYFRSLAIAGPVSLDNGFSSPGITLTLDRSTLRGSFAYQPAKDAARPQFTTNLTSDALDLDSIPDLGSFAPSAADTDFKLALEARTVKLVRIGAGVLESGHISLDLARKGPNLDINTFNFDNIGGASLVGSGAVTPSGTSLKARLDAAKFDELAKLLKRLFPSPWSEALARRANVLAPLKLEFDGESANADLYDPAGWRKLTLNGTMAATKLALNLQGSDGSSIATLALQAGDITSLFAQLGLPTLPLVKLGKADITMIAQHQKGGTLNADIAAALAGTDFSWKARATPDLGAVEGHWSLNGRDAAPLLQALAIILPDFQTSLPADLTGEARLNSTHLELADLHGSLSGIKAQGQLALDWASDPQLSGALNVDHLDAPNLLSILFGPPQPAKAGALWPEAKFASGMADLPRTRIELKAAALNLGNGLAASNAELGLELAQGRLSFTPFSLNMLGGTIKGDLTFRRAGQNASLNAGTKFSGINLPSAILQGGFSGDLAFAGTGQSWANLIGGLAGSGSMQIQGGRLKTLTADALARVVNAVERDEINADVGALNKALAQELDKGTASVAPEPFNIALATGQLKFGPGKLLSPNDTPWSAAFDLRNSQFDLNTALGLQSLPKNWSEAPPQIELRWHGPYAAPIRMIEAGNLANALAARAIARSQAKIEALDADIRERSFFLRRLKASQAADAREKAEQEAAAKLKAQQDEEARKKAEDARRALDAAKELMKTAPKAPPPQIILPEPGLAPEPVLPLPDNAPLQIAPVPNSAPN